MAVTLSELPEYLERIDYPVSHEAVIDEHGEVVVEYANGELTLQDLLANSSQDEYESDQDLHAAVENGLPRDAVGEPYQSEGEG